QLARGDFFARNSKVFSLMNQNSSRELSQMKGFLRKGAGRLVQEGLNLKNKASKSLLSKQFEKGLITRIHLEISQLDDFVQKFIVFAN
ncbi:hypothetical protein MJH12_00035, partial [bacterium]|nr:hypothetical protein [bacterium]